MRSNAGINAFSVSKLGKVGSKYILFHAVLTFGTFIDTMIMMVLYLSSQYPW
jgi:hypothetical protein